MRLIPWNKKTVLSAIRTFSLCVGTTAVSMLIVSGFLDPQFPEGNLPDALEASVFNNGKSFSADSAAGELEDTGNYVIPLGSTFGIKLFTDGVIVASLSDIYTENGLACPAAQAGLKPGDYLLEANGSPLKNNAALAKAIGKTQGEPLLLKVRRGEEVFETSVTPVYGDGAFKTGMWVRDSAAGIGTLTFFDPEHRVFAGLGHGICDMDTSGVMALKSGEPAEITLCGIKKGEENEPGQLKGYFSSDEPLGSLLANNETGVYGTFLQEPVGRPLEVLPKDEVKNGPVQIIASIDESGPQRYEAEIVKVSATKQHTKNLVLKITDPRLLEATGGIVQGMSGAPILQGGKLCGAVTHVFTEDPTSGYGIFAQTMVEQARAIAAQTEQDAA